MPSGSKERGAKDDPRIRADWYARVRSVKVVNQAVLDEERNKVLRKMVDDWN